MAEHVPQGGPSTASGRLETICVPRPRCPRCQGIDLQRYRSIADQGDGSSLSWVRCRNPDCHHRFRLLLE